MKHNRRLRCKSSYLRPLLTEDNKEERMKFALSFVTKNHVFDDMHDVGHVDEKWFFLTKDKGKFYVYDDETLPHRQSKSKPFITKVITHSISVMVAARLNLDAPRWDQSTFEGRARHFFTTTNPINVLATDEQLDAAKALVQQYQYKPSPPVLLMYPLLAISAH
ncbi:hypothetical protein DYB34_010552 [Aphanomyces astaci]|uniref:Uncharacterized protein n=1 Tax=Aphanomyces astaci TaxID=112090 RepID=A0A397FBU3_APHAT|nr:hypothetical protein DYB34_010552 [Aphanomyces astaci]RHZ25250.1 hypothetical protein DYB31_010614 [Aphanomyces astaci]